MRAARGRWPGLSLLLLVALLACPCYAAGLSLAEETQEEEYESWEAIDSEDGSTNSTDTETTSTDVITASTHTTTKKPNTEPTSDGSTPTGDTKPPTDNPNTSTPTPPHDDLTLYEYTKEELNVTEEILEKCSSLVSSKRSSTGGVMDSPAGWWKLKKEQTQEVKSSTIDNFCKNDTSECDELYTSLSDIMTLLTSLTANVDGWTLQDLDDLTVKNEELEDAYQAAKDVSDFQNLIDKETFQDVISHMLKEVKRSQEIVNTKISDIKKDRTGSVVLVAVIGSLGGIMIVSIAGVMIYSAVKKKKTKKESSNTPYNKLQGENIPIDAFLSDAPRADPYTNQSPPHSRGDPYPSPYSGRSEPMPRVTRIGKALPRTHF